MGSKRSAALLAQLKPLVFFDDSEKNFADAWITTPTVRIPVEEPVKVVTVLSSNPGRSPEQFLHVCKRVLKKTFDDHEPELRAWHSENVEPLGDGAHRLFAAEFERSAQGTPRGRQRRAAGAKNEDFTKMMQFLQNALRKYGA